jgi:hypothetical protein
MADLFACNITVEVAFDRKGVTEIAGYLFVTNGPEAGAQEQRWVLWPGYTPLPHDGTILFRAPPAELAFTTLEGFWDAVTAGGRSGLWRTGSTYVKVASRAYTEMVDPQANAPAYPTLTMDAHFKTQTFNRRKKKGTGVIQGGSQIESRTWQIQSWTLEQWVRTGKVCGSNLKQDASEPALWTNREWWVTLPDYQPPLSAGPEARVLLQPGETVMTLDEAFRDIWTEGAIFTIASCSYLEGIPASP